MPKREWFIHYRKQKGLTQQGLVERIAPRYSMTRQHISAIERGLTNPSIKLAKALGEELGFNWVQFFE